MFGIMPNEIFFFMSRSKKIDYLPEYSDFKMNEIFEFLSDFGHSDGWSTWKSVFSKKRGKSCFLPYGSAYASISQKQQQKLDDWIFDCCLHFGFRMAKILKFPKFSKISNLTSIILHYGQNRPGTRKSGLKWNLSILWKKIKIFDKNFFQPKMR